MDISELNMRQTWEKKILNFSWSSVNSSGSLMYGVLDVDLGDSLSFCW
jgi:hypothetical protein